MRALFLLAVLGIQDDDATPQLTRDATAWAEVQEEQAWDVFEGEEHVARVRLTAGTVQQGEDTYLELLLERTRPVDAEHAEREVCWLRLDAELSPHVVRLFEPTERATQRARVGLAEGKLTGTVDGRGLVRNVPTPLVTEAGMLLRAALLPREEGARLRVTRLTFDRRGAVVEVDEALAFVGVEEGVALVEHRAPRGRVRAVYRFGEGGELLGYETRGKGGVRWVRSAAPEEDDPPRPLDPDAPPTLDE